MKYLPPIPENKKIKSGFKPNIVKKMNEDEPYATVFSLNYENFGSTIQMEIPVIFKN